MLPRLDRNAYRLNALRAFLLVSFLFAEGIVLVHDLDPEAYEADHVCQVCSVASVLGAANVAATRVIAVMPPDRSVDPEVSAPVVSRSVVRARARAPPIFS
jgi:hypothetical protein